MKFKHIASEFNVFKKYDIDTIWKEIMQGKDFIYQNTNLFLDGDKAIIFVDDNSILMALKMQEKTLTKNIVKYLPNINEIEFKKINKIVKTRNNNSNNNYKIGNIEVKKDYSKEIESIKKRVHKKYENIEDEMARKMYIGYTLQKELDNFRNKINKAIKCRECKEYFQRVEKENICILCRNKKYKKDIKFIKEKIYKDPELTKEYAKKIYNISENIYGLAISQILDEKMNAIYYKIEINLENKIIDLSNELEEYAKYYAGTLERETLRIVINKLKIRLTNNTLKIHNKEVEIKG